MSDRNLRTRDLRRDLPARVLSWDYRQQPDLDVLASAVREASGGLATVHQIDTGSQEYAIVVADHRVTAEEAAELWRRHEEG